MDNFQYAYLGTVLFSPAVLDEHPLDVIDFTGNCRAVFQEMQRLHALGTIPDEITLMGCKAWTTVALEITSYNFTAANAGYYAEKLREKTKQRCFTSLGPMVSEMQEKGSPAEDIGREINRYLALSERNAANGISLGDSLRLTIAQMDRRGLRGLSTGYRRLDVMLSGLQPSNLYIIAGRPGMGKSAWAGNLSELIAGAGHKVVVFTLEMAHEQWTQRMLYSQATVNSSHGNDGTFSHEDYTRIVASATEMHGWPMRLYDQPALRIDMMRSITRREKPALVIVDYLQLATATAEKRHEEVATISRGLKALAKESRIPVVALAQMNRASDAREKKRPVLSDLRESGQIEQDADAVIFLYRPSYYCDECMVHDKGDCGKEGHGTTAEIIVAKNRHGKGGIVKADYIGENFKFMERLS